MTPLDPDPLDVTPRDEPLLVARDRFWAGWCLGVATMAAALVLARLVLP